MCHHLSKHQHRQNEPAGQVDIPARLEVHVMTGILDTCVGTTDISPPVKNKTDRVNLAGKVDIPMRVEVCVTGDLGHLPSR